MPKQNPKIGFALGYHRYHICDKHLSVISICAGRIGFNIFLVGYYYLSHEMESQKKNSHKFIKIPFIPNSINRGSDCNCHFDKSE